MFLLCEVIREYGCLQYADDTHLYLSIPSSPVEVVDTLNQFLEEVMGWIQANMLKFNPDRLEVLLVESSLILECGFMPTSVWVVLTPKSPVSSGGK